MIQAQQLTEMGALAEKVQQEAEKALMETQQKMSAEADRLMEEERKQLEEEMMQREEEARVEAMAEEAALEVTEVETKVNHAEELAMPLMTAQESESPEGLYEAAVVTEESINTAQAELNHVAAAMKEKWSTFSKKTGQLAGDMLQKLGPNFRSLHARLAVCRRTLAKLQASTKATKGKVEKQVLTMRKEREQKEQFQKHDADGDGKLCREEIGTYARMEHQLDLTTSQLDKICAKLSGDDGGVTQMKMPQLIRALTSVKAEAREQAKKEEEIQRKQEFQEKMKSFTALAASVEEVLAQAEKAEDFARGVARPLLSKASERLDAHRLVQLSVDTENELAPAKSKLEKALESIAEIDTEANAEAGTKDVIAAKKQEVARLRSRARKLQEKISKLSAAVEKARHLSARQSFTDLQRLRNSVVLDTNTTMASEGQSVDQLYARVGGASGIQRDQFIAFVTPSCTPLDLEESDAGNLFDYVAEGETSIDLKKFTTFLTLHFKVVRSTMLTSGAAINSKVSCRLDAGETLQLLEGPIKDEKVGLTRVRCRSIAKNSEGWATMAGNQGTVFLQPQSLFFHCVKEAAMTDALEIKSSKTLRDLDVGEVVEALGPEEKDSSTKTNVMRIRCKARSDGLIGWVSLAGSAGIVLLAPC